MEKSKTLTTLVVTKPILTEQEIEEEEEYSYRQPYFPTKEDLFEKIDRAHSELVSINEQINGGMIPDENQQMAYARTILTELPKFELIMTAANAFSKEGNYTQSTQLQYLSLDLNANLDTMLH